MPLNNKLGVPSAITLAVTALLAAPPAHALITLTGQYFVSPINLPVGPGDTDLGTSALYVGNGAAGTLTVNAGSKFDLGQISLASNGNGTATAVIDGVNSRVRLRGDGNVNRLEVGSWGVASMTVSGGATLDGRFNASACLLGAQFCNNFVGATAGSNGTLTVTGAGSNASFLRDFVVGGLAVFAPPGSNSTYGTPGGVVQGQVNVLAGGTLTTDVGTLGKGPEGTGATGTERSFATVVVSGANSLWNLTGGVVDNGTARLITAIHPNATANLTVSNGGRINLSPVANTVHFINLTTGGGKTDMLLTGAGSVVDLNGGAMTVGRSGGTARLDIAAGGAVDEGYFFAIGRNSSYGRVTIDGAGSRVTVNRNGPAGSSDAAFTGSVHIGRDGGIGQLDITNGGRLEVLSGVAASDRARTLLLGFGAASQGTLNISGAASRLVMEVASAVPGGGPTEALNPYLSVGYQGVGYLNLTGGAKIWINGSAISTVANSRGTTFIVGGRDDTNAGGQGFATISGAGSELRLTGSDTYIGIGHGPQSFGQLIVENQASASATGINVGRSGGVGILKVNSAVLNLSGQHTGSAQAGAFLNIGRSGGTGVAEFTNGSVITLNNMGTAGASLSLGGTSIGPIGDGSLTVSGGSQVLIQAAAGLGGVTVGRDGSGVLRVKGASLIDVGDGNFYVARLTGSDGTVIATENSVINAGWVGVGRNKTATGSVDGGTGTFVLNGATLNVSGDVVIGTNGFLGGSAGSINVSGSVTNYGIFSPGNSPGVFTINGNYTAGAGSRLVLEVQANATGGGFSTDQVFFSEGAALDFGGMQVEFRFLGDTDPNAFQASGAFDIDTFLARNLSGGGTAAINPSLLTSANFTAQADNYTFTSFTFDAVNGAAFTAVPVPEPGSWALMLAGAAAVLRFAQRQRRAG